MNATGRKDLDDILDAIREVEVSLERRSERATGAIMMVWGAMGAIIFGFYHLVTDDSSLAATLGKPVVSWAWVLPVLLGYSLTAVAGARLGRIRARRGEAAMRRLLVAIAVPVLVLVALVATGRGVEAIPAMWVAFVGYTLLLPPSREGLARSRVCLVAGTVSLVVGAGLLAPALHPWANLVACLWYAFVLGGVGVAKYSGRL